MKVSESTKKAYQEKQGILQKRSGLQNIYGKKEYYNIFIQIFWLSRVFTACSNKKFWLHNKISSPKRIKQKN